MSFNPDPKHPWTIEQVEAIASVLFDEALKANQFVETLESAVV
jgi:hypothetical protein